MAKKPKNFRFNEKTLNNFEYLVKYYQEVFSYKYPELDRKITETDVIAAIINERAQSVRDDGFIG